ncbi:MAG TPA: LPS export ABC transporter ATP-binding protein [Gemmatimonadales bacterium]|jgi:lipopolysaccharide export system ATP-binding protein
MTADELLSQLVRRDLSHCLAVASLLKAPDEQGGTTVEQLAVTYREDYLRAQEAAGVKGQLDAGTLAMDDVRRHLVTSVLPRLATEAIIEERIGWTDETVTRLGPDIWQTLGPVATEARDRLIAAAASSMLSHDAAPARVSSPASDGSRIEGIGLTKSYGGRTVVNNVNIRLAQGEIVGLLGPNGAGKTTTFYMVTGLIAPQSGKILLDGTDIGRLPMYRRARRGIGYLAQEPSVFRKLTVEQNLLAILETMPMSRGQRRQRLEELLDELSLKHLRRNKAYSLSGGERRRLEITRALCTRPKFMLLDEPFSGVDPIAVHDIQKIVAGLRHRGIGVLITDHNVEQTLDIVDRAYIMFEGKVQVAGTVRELVFNDRVAELYLGPTLTARLRERLGAAA